MPTHFIDMGGAYRVASDEQLSITDTLPVGTYTVKYNEMGGFFYLERIKDFTHSAKVYGDTDKQAKRILNTFADRSASTGCLFSGDKGSGKTLLAKRLSMIGAEQGIPTIVINQPWHGELFNTFMQQIEQAAIVLFDEFEKVYDKDTQEKMLTLLDGVYPSKKLFILTCNDKWRIDEHMRNRPGRIYYRLEFEGLEPDFVREYCIDNLDNTHHLEKVVKVSEVFPKFNFDMLKALIEEMNRYKESPVEALKMLNAKPEYSSDESYEVSLTVDGLVAEPNGNWHGNPLSGEQISVWFTVDVPAGKKISGVRDDEDEDDFDVAEALEEMNDLLAGDGRGVVAATRTQGRRQRGRAIFTIEDLQTRSEGTGRYTFSNVHGQILTLTRKTESRFQWEAL